MTKAELKPPKPKKCRAKGCGVVFTPARPFQCWCSPDCGLTIARAKKEQADQRKRSDERKADRAKLESSSRQNQNSQRKHRMSSTVTSGCEMLAGPASAVIDLLEKTSPVVHMTLATIDQSGAPPIYALMSGTYTPSESNAICGGLGELLIIDWGSSSELASMLSTRLKLTKP